MWRRIWISVIASLGLLCLARAAIAADAAAPAANEATTSAGCSQINYFTNLTPSFASTGVESLKATWIRAYSQPTTETSPASNKSKDAAQGTAQAGGNPGAADSPNAGQGSWKNNITAWSMRFGSTVVTGSDATRIQLLNHDSGEYNLFLSFVGIRNTGSAKYDCNNPTVNARHYAVDRYYLPGILTYGKDNMHSDISPGAGLYIVNGFGLSALSKSTTASATPAPNSNASPTSNAPSVSGTYGTAYIGLGLDGQWYANDDSALGYSSIQTYFSYSKINQTIASSAFPAAGTRNFRVIGTNFEFYLTKSIALRLDYTKGVGAFGNAFLGNMFSVALSMAPSVALSASTPAVNKDAPAK